MDTKKDIVWEYFDLLREHGEEASFTIKRFQGESPIDSVRFDHRNYDGISAMCELARTLPADGFTPPTLTVKLEPSLLKKFWLLLKWSLYLWPGIGKAWQTSNAKTRPVSAFVRLSPSEWTNLKTNGGTARVIAALDLTAQKYLQPSWLPRLWMIPVGLYPQITRDLPPRNRVSFVDLRLFETGTALKTITTQLRESLTEGRYWGSFLSMYALKLLGKKLFIRQLQFMHHFFRRTGTLTNVGDWKIPTLPPEEWWAVQVTVVKISPVGASMLEVNGNLGLSVQFHQCLGWSEAQAQAFVKEWKAHLLG